MDGRLTIDEALARIGELVDLLLPRLRTPGLALAVTDRERTLGFVCRGGADLATRAPVTPACPHIG